ncbi:PEP-CTERM sorting domain-containing protein [Candidatus Scalindua japonica]|nr:PEP-CTERM sorting domain-containing protein [Candidatus Scalindua japonica]
MPEPGTIVMLGIGLAGLGVVYLRRRWREKAGRGREENGSYSTG